MKKKTSKYLELAIYYSDHIEGFHGICGDLKNPKTFIKMFEPKDRERKKYNLGYLWWMNQGGLSRKQNNNFRILALLFMHEITINP